MADSSWGIRKTAENEILSQVRMIKINLQVSGIFSSILKGHGGILQVILWVWAVQAWVDSVEYIQWDKQQSQTCSCRGKNIYVAAVHTGTERGIQISRGEHSKLMEAKSFKTRHEEVQERT